MQGVILSGGLTAVLVAATTCSGATFTAGDLVSFFKPPESRST